MNNNKYPHPIFVIEINDRTKNTPNKTLGGFVWRYIPNQPENEPKRNPFELPLFD